MVNPYRWMVSFLGRPDKTGARRRFYYFRRPGFPIVRIKAEPETIEFDAVYNRIARAESIAEVEALRARLGMRPKPPNRVHDYDAIDRFLDECERAVRRRAKK